MRPILTLPMLLILAGCKSDGGLTAQKRCLVTELLTFDAGTVAVNSRQTLSIYPASTCSGPVKIFDVYVEDQEDIFVVLDDWKTTGDTAGDTASDSTMEIENGTLSDPTYGELEVSFRPDARDYFRTTLVILSNDTEVTERATFTDENGKEHDLGVWRVTLRGLGRYPCALVYPTFVDYGPKPSGGYYSEPGYVENCGQVTLTVTNFEVTGSKSFYVDTPDPLYVLPGAAEPIELAFVPGDTEPASAEITVQTDASNDTTPITVIGNDCDLSINTAWDGDGDGWFECGGDCDDDNAAISPSAQENTSNDKDDDCDGSTDESSNAPGTDNDGDGYSENKGDCDDTDTTISPGAAETINLIDDDCDGKTDNNTENYDDDGDGYSERAGDCDDSDVLVYPGATETYNGYDDDCDSLIDEGSYFFDDDEDGFHETGVDGTGTDVDCNDADPWTYPAAIEDCDERDNDCDGLIDEGEDDSELGACAFVVGTKAPEEERTQCNAVVGPGAGLLLGLSGLLAGLRRRRQHTI
jgi:Putative metal-binding motif